jgi:hypothetical protein
MKQTRAKLKIKSAKEKKIIMKRHTETNTTLKGHGRREESMTDPFTVHVRVINS